MNAVTSRHIVFEVTIQPENMPPDHPLSEYMFEWADEYRFHKIGANWYAEMGKGLVWMGDEDSEQVADIEKLYQQWIES